MSSADKVFDENIRTILSSGYSTVNDKVRPHWADDGSPAYTYKAFGIVNRYDLGEHSNYETNYRWTHRFCCWAIEFEYEQNHESNKNNTFRVRYNLLNW